MTFFRYVPIEIQAPRAVWNNPIMPQRGHDPIGMIGADETLLRLDVHTDEQGFLWWLVATEHTMGWIYTQRNNGDDFVEVVS